MGASTFPASNRLIKTFVFITITIIAACGGDGGSLKSQIRIDPAVNSQLKVCPENKTPEELAEDFLYAYLSKSENYSPIVGRHFRLWANVGVVIADPNLVNKFGLHSWNMLDSEINNLNEKIRRITLRASPSLIDANKTLRVTYVLESEEAMIKRLRVYRESSEYHKNKIDLFIDSGSKCDSWFTSHEFKGEELLTLNIFDRIEMGSAEKIEDRYVRASCFLYVAYREMGFMGIDKNDARDLVEIELIDLKNIPKIYANDIRKERLVLSQKAKFLLWSIISLEVEGYASINKADLKRILTIKYISECK